MQSPAAFPWCLPHTCAHCIMCRLCLVAGRLLRTYGLSVIDGWIRVPTLEALPCQRGACPHTSVHHQPLSSGTVVRFPKTMITFPQKQTSVLTPFLAGVWQHEGSFVGVCSLPPRALVKLHSCVCKTCQEANTKVRGESGACSSFMITISKYLQPCKMSSLCRKRHHIPSGKEGRAGGVSKNSKVRLLHLQSGHL